jgi:DNA-binding transcriptional ArsR family regulator
MDRDRYHVELDGELLDVLASDTRRGILQSLAERRRTLSELSRDLDRNKSTIHEHLGRLSDADLVVRDENEDRKWTYYELTEEGQRIVEPEETQVRLIIGTAVAGLLAGALVVAALGSFAGFPNLAGSPADGPDASSPEAGSDPGTDALTVSVDQTSALATSGTTLEATVPGAGDLEGPWRAFLVPEDQAEALRTESSTPSGIEVNATVEGENLTVRLPGHAEPGDYRLYVVAGGQRANVEDLPRIQLRDSLAEVRPGTFHRGFTGSVEVERTSTLVPADATVVLRPADGGGQAAAVDLSEGTGNLSTELLDTLPDGTYRLQAIPDDGAPLPLGVTLQVETPNVVVAPQVVREDRPVDLRIHVQPSQAWAGDPAVRVGGEARDPAVVDRDTRGLRIEPSQAGPLDVRVGRSVEQTLDVQPRIDATLEVVDGPAWEVTVRNETGDEVPGVDLRLDGRYQASTNASGEARLPIPDEGGHALGLELPGGSSVEAPLAVEGWNATVLKPRLGIGARASSPAPGTVNVSVETRNPRPAALSGTLVAQVGDEVAGAGTVAVGPNETREEELTLPNATGGDVDVTVVASAPASPSLAVRNSTGEGGGGTTEDGDDGGGPALETGGEGAVEAGTASDRVSVSPRIEGFEETDAFSRTLQEVPLPGSTADAGEDETAGGGGDAAPGPGAILQAGVLAAVALAMGAARQLGRD